MNDSQLVRELRILRDAYLLLSYGSRENLKGDALKKTLDSLIGSHKFGVLRFRAAGVAHIAPSAIRQIPKSEAARELLGVGEDADLRRNAKAYTKRLHLEHMTEHKALHSMFWENQMEELARAYSLAIITDDERILLDKTGSQGPERYTKAGVEVR